MSNDDTPPTWVLHRFSRRQLIRGGVTGAFGVAVGTVARPPRSLRFPVSYVVQVGVSSTRVVAKNREHIEVELRNASRSRIVFVTQGATAWLRAGQCLLPGESLQTNFTGGINAVVDAYGDAAATAPLTVRLR
jgi:hypothetical protein